MICTITHNITENLATEIQIPQKGILSRTLFNDSATKLILFGFAPGEELTAHTAPMPATIQIVQGEAEIKLGEETVHAGPGCLIHMEPHLTHGILAKSPVLMLLTLIKAGRVDGKTGA
jgi:quercetin dioxygenase-like cupin family protein